MHLFKRCILCSFEGILVISCCFCSSDAVTDVQVQLLKFRINFCCSYTVTEVQIQFLLSRCRYRVVQKKYLPPPPSIQTHLLYSLDAVSVQLPFMVFRWGGGGGGGGNQSAAGKNWQTCFQPSRFMWIWRNITCFLPLPVRGSESVRPQLPVKIQPQITRMAEQIYCCIPHTHTLQKCWWRS